MQEEKIILIIADVSEKYPIPDDWLLRLSALIAENAENYTKIIGVHEKLQENVKPVDEPMQIWADLAIENDEIEFNSTQELLSVLYQRRIIDRAYLWAYLYNVADEKITIEEKLKNKIEADVIEAVGNINVIKQLKEECILIEDYAFNIS